MMSPSHEIDVEFTQDDGRAHVVLVEPETAGNRDVVLRYRLAPDSPEVRAALLETAEKVKALDWVLPLVEAAAQVVEGPGASVELASVARLSQEKLEDRDRAFDLLTFAPNRGE